MPTTARKIAPAMSSQTATMTPPMSTETVPSAAASFSPSEKESVGKLLKRTREEKNLSLDEAARATKIRKDFLLAIEDDQFEALPGPVFARGFIRSYGEYLALDAQSLLTRVSRAIEGKDMPEIPGVTPKAPAVSWPILTAGVGAATALAVFLLSR